MAPVITPAFPFPKIDHLTKTNSKCLNKRVVRVCVGEGGSLKCKFKTEEFSIILNINEKEKSKFRGGEGGGYAMI